MNKTFFKLLPVVIASTLLVMACSLSSTSSGVYAVRETGNEMRVRTGVIESISPVTIRPGGQEGAAGTLVGGLLGGIAGSGLGKGNERSAATVLGAVAGATIGENVQQSINTRQGVQIIIKLDSGATIAVVQDTNQDLRVGDRVNVIGNGSVTRVMRR